MVYFTKIKEPTGILQQKIFFFHFGLAIAIDASDFNVKLEILKST